MNWFSAFLSIFSRTWLKVLRRPVILLLSFLQPLIWMCFFGFLFQRFPLGEMPEGVRYIDFLVPGICVMTVLVGASQSGIGLIRDMQTGFLGRLLYSPANNLAMLSGKLSADVLRLLLQASVVAIIGMAIGARFRFDFSGLTYSVICLIIFTAAYCLLSCWIALLARKQETMASFVHLVNMPVFFTEHGFSASETNAKLVGNDRNLESTISSSRTVASVDGVWEFTNNKLFPGHVGTLLWIAGRPHRLPMEQVPHEPRGVMMRTKRASFATTLEDIKLLLRVVIFTIITTMGCSKTPSRPDVLFFAAAGSNEAVSQICQLYEAQSEEPLNVRTCFAGSSH